MIWFTFLLWLEKTVFRYWKVYFSLYICLGYVVNIVNKYKWRTLDTMFWTFFKLATLTNLCRNILFFEISYFLHPAENRSFFKLATFPHSSFWKKKEVINTSFSTSRPIQNQLLTCRKPPWSCPLQNKAATSRGTKIKPDGRLWLKTSQRLKLEQSKKRLSNPVSKIIVLTLYFRSLKHYHAMFI
jgi:hypothetical protein